MVGSSMQSRDATGSSYLPEESSGRRGGHVTCSFQPGSTKLSSLSYEVRILIRELHT